MYITITQAPLFDKKSYPYIINTKVSQTIQEIVKNNKLQTSIPFICQINGLSLLRKYWADYIPKEIDIITFTYYPLQGGEGRGTSRAIAMLSVLALSSALPGALGITSHALSGTLTATTSAIGALAVNAILPPVSHSFGDFANIEQPSPTYSIQAQANQARIGSVIPVQYGRHKIYPDFAASPYHSYIDNEQYLHVLFCIGQGYFDTENAQIYVDDTPLENYTSIAYNWMSPNDKLIGYDFKTVVSEVSFFEMRGSNEEQNLSNVDTTDIIDERWLGWYTVNNSDTKTDAIEIDFSLPQGLNGVVEWEIYAREIDNNSLPINNDIINLNKLSYATVTKTYILKTASNTITTWPSNIVYSDNWDKYAEKKYINETRIYLGEYFQSEHRTIYRYKITEFYKQINTECKFSNNAIGFAQYFTRLYAFPHASRWQVRLRRTNKASTDISNPDKLYIVGIKGNIVDVTRPPDVTLLAMTIKATEILTQSNLRINTVIQRKLPIYENDQWTEPKPTNSIAWALADVLKNPVYGGELDDRDFDLRSLQNLEKHCSSQGDEFNGVFDTSKTLWQVLQDIAKCARSIPVYQSGRISFVRDTQQLTAVQMFSDRNIVKGSFSLSYIMASDKPSGNIEAEYYDAKIWKQKTVKTCLDGTGSKSTRIRLFGITNQEHAQRECNYMARANSYRRTNIHFTTELEGLNVQFGDLIKVSHEMPGWGFVRGDIIAYEEDTKTLILDSDIKLKNSDDYVILLRDVDGKPKGAYSVKSVYMRNVILNEFLDFTPKFSQGEYPHYVIGKKQNYAVDAIVRKVIPRGNLVKIEAVIDDVRVYQEA